MKKYLSIAAALIVMVGVVATTGTAGTSYEEPCESQDAWTETTGWVLESPGAGWYQVDEKTVVDEEAYDEVVQEGVDQWYHWNGSNQGPPPPPPPAAGWNTDNGNHNGLKSKPDYAPSTVFDASSKGGNNASWFFHSYAEEQTEHYDAVTHQEFKFALDHPAVDCPGEELVGTSASVEPLQPSCENAGEIGLLLGNEDEVDYSIEGDIAPGSTVSVTASAKAGFELMGDDEWEIAFDSFDPSSCEEDPDDPTDPTDPADPGSGEKPTLTSSGSGSSSSSGPQVKAATTSDAPTGSTLPFTH
jgi:hypothetical protein